MSNLEEAAKYCKNWFKSNNIPIPNSVQEWQKGRSGVTVPKGFTYASIRNKGLSVGQLLECMSDGTYKNRVKNTYGDILFIGELGFTLISISGIETITYKCNGCGNIKNSLKHTLQRNYVKKLKYCVDCRKASGAIKSIEYYQKFLDPMFEVLYKKETKLYIRHKNCDTLFSRSCGYIVGDQRIHSSMVECPNCSTKTTFIYNKNITTSYNSLSELTLINKLKELMPELLIKQEVPYKSLMNTSRHYRLDVWLPEYDVGIELSSKNNNLPGYKKRIEEKLALASINSVKIYFATSTKDIEDIVQSLLKNKEL